MNEFQLWWEFKGQFPLHFIVFKQFTSHLPAPHEANVEQVFSLSGALAVPNLTPEHLTCKYSKLGKAFVAGSSDEEGASSDGEEN